MIKLEIMYTLDFDGYRNEEFSGIVNEIKTTNICYYEDTEGNNCYGYETVLVEVENLSDVYYIDSEREKWFLYNVASIGDILYPVTWSQDKANRVKTVDIEALY